LFRLDGYFTEEKRHEEGLPASQASQLRGQMLFFCQAVSDPFKSYLVDSFHFLSNFFFSEEKKQLQMKIF
jgi:hypothetical protein